MALTPQEFNEYADVIPKIYRELEEKIINLATENISFTVQMSQAEYLAEKYIILNKLAIDTQTEINKASQRSISTIADILKEANKHSIESEVKQLRNLSSPMYESIELTASRYKSQYSFEFDKIKLTEADRQIINAMIRQTQGEFVNMSRSLGFDGKPYQAAYNFILDSAHYEIASGGSSYQQAIKKAIKTLTDNGMEYIDFKNGRKERADSVARRAVMTGLAKTTNEISMRNALDFGVKLVETSYHTGHRREHDWGGQVFSLEENYKDYKYFYKETGYGTAEGLGGYNCRHSFFPFFEGISERAYTDEYIREQDSLTYEYKGESYNQYQAAQKQRSIERRIRQLQREKNVFMYEKEKGGFGSAFFDEELAAINRQLKNKRREYKEFSEQMKFLPENDKLGIGNFGKSQSTKSALADKALEKLRLASVDGKKDTYFLLEKVDFNNKDMVKSILEKYEKIIVEKDYENAIVITKKGNVYRVIGEEVGVNPSVIGEDIKGSYVTHNHPKEWTNYSFSSEDIIELFESRNTTMRGVDDLFEYEINILPQTAKNIPEDLDNKFSFYYMSEAREKFIEEFAYSEDSNEAAYFAYDYVNKKLSKVLKYDYKRRRKKE